MAGLEGSKIADYEVLAKIGQGGFGAVYMAREVTLDRLVALKTLPPQLAEDRDYVARFRRKAIAAAQLDHPNIVRVYTAGESNGTHFIAMELVEGQTLHDHLKHRGPMAPTEALGTCLAVAQALGYAWNKSKIIHRDIKPSNIFINNEGEVKVGDLGLVKHIGGESIDITHSGVTVGTPHYCSPEQARGDKDIDFRADIYSLGCTLYHMLSGQKPYEGSTDQSPVAIMVRQVTDPPPSITRVMPACPVPVALVLGKMLAKQPAARHRSYDELVQDMQRIITRLKTAEAQPVSAAVKPAVPRVVGSVPAPRKFPAALIYTLVGAAVVLVLAMLCLWQSWKERKASERGAVSVQRQTGSAGVPPASEQQQKQKPEIPSIAPTVAETAAKPEAALTPSKEVPSSLPQTIASVPTASQPPGSGGMPVLSAVVATDAALKQLGSVFTNVVGAEMVYIPPGEFMLGSTKEEQAWAVANGEREATVKCEGEAPRKAAIKQGFWMGRTEVTVGQWKQFVKETGYVTDAEKKGESYVYRGPRKPYGQMKGKSWRDPNFGFELQNDHPVCCVSWNDAIAFCEWATERERKAGRMAASQVVRLPTEAEWEYACRARTQTKFWWGESKDDGNRRLNWSGKDDGYEFVAPVDNYGTRGRNGFGLADMLGNVWEWCLDKYDVTQAHEECYKGNSSARALRGGSFTANPHLARCAGRIGRTPAYSNCDLGFRVCCGVDVGGGATAVASPSALAAARDVDDAFIREVAALPAEEKVQRVVVRLKELNPGFDGRETHKIEGSVVTELSFSTVAVKNITPLRALTELKKLMLVPQGAGAKGMLSDLSPLQGMPLTFLACGNAAVSDLSPLKSMPLTVLSVDNTAVSDLSPLSGMPLEILWCNNAKVTDLSPLENMPLKELRCDSAVAHGHAAFLRGIKTLGRINDMPAAAFWARTGPATIPITTGKSVIRDPLNNLMGDQSYRFIDIIEASIERRADHYYLTVKTVVPLPRPAELFGGKRVNFIFFIDADRNRATGQSKDGNEYNIHLTFDEKGWRHSWYKVTEVSKADGIYVDRDSFKFATGTDTATLSFPTRFLSSQHFDWWCAAHLHQTNVVLSQNPPTDRATFDAAAKPQTTIAPMPSVSAPALTILREQGVFGFPQKEARVICDNEHLRLSVCNNAEYLYFQALLWGEDASFVESAQQAVEPAEESSYINLILDADGRPTEPANRIYVLSAKRSFYFPSLGYQRLVVSRETLRTGGRLAWTPRTDDRKGRGSIRYVRLDVNKMVRVDNFLIPLSDVGRTQGGKILFWFYAQAKNPEFCLDSFGRYSKKIAYSPWPRSNAHELILNGNGRINPTEVPDGRSDRGPAVVSSGKSQAPPGDDSFTKTVSILPAKQQVQRVMEKLKELNPQFDGVETHKIERGQVTDLSFRTDVVSDISPVRALRKLRKLTCALPALRPPGDKSSRRGMLADLSPLRGLALEELDCSKNPITDLSPLKGMPLKILWCGESQVSDLSPLKGMRLTNLSCSNSQVSDLSPLVGLPLETLNCVGCPIADLSPLRGAPIQRMSVRSTQVSDLLPLKGMSSLDHLSCENARVTDLAPLKDTRIRSLTCDFVVKRDASILRSIATLTSINNKPVSEFLK